MHSIRSLALSAMASIALLPAAGPAATGDAPTTTPLPAGMVAAAHPLAARAGARVLREGGNAVDAAVATAFTLNVVEPHASGIGGGGFILTYKADTGRVHILDYRETAPAAIGPEHYTIDGRTTSTLMRKGGLAVGAPGMVRGLLKAHAEHGTVPRRRLLEDAIRHADEGVTVSSDLAGHIENNLDTLLEDGTAAAIFLEDGLLPLAEGAVVRQPKLAALLRRVAGEGEAAVYNPEVAGHIAAAVRQSSGVLTARDIMDHRPRERAPLSATYRGHEIVTISPPSSGGLTVLLTLSILDRFDLSGMTPDSPEYLSLLAKAFEAAQRATDRHVADPDFVDVPVAALLDATTITETARGIAAALGLDTASTTAPARPAAAPHRPTTKEPPGNTTHLSVVDAQGNMVALTQTINDFFGAGVFVPEHGIIMNNELFDFTFSQGGSPNAPQPGKRPRSSIAPLLVVRDGRPVATLGTPGGRRIPSALVQILVRCIDFGQPLQQAIDAPRIHVEHATSRITYETRIAPEVIDATAAILGRNGTWVFEKKGGMDNYFGGAQGIWIRDTPDGTRLEGAADPRRNGAVADTLSGAD